VIWRRRRALDDLDQDIRDHLARETEANVARGLSPEEADAAARRAFGSITRIKEDTRAVWVPIWADQLLQDGRFVLRLLRRSPGFAFLNLATLALGIGLTTAVFSVVDAVLLRPLAMTQPDRLVLLRETWRDLLPGFSVGNFVDLRKLSTSFDAIGASNSGGFNLSTADVPERVLGERVTAGYFDVARVRPILGRTFTDVEDTPGHAQVVVVSERLWRSRLRADPDIVGKVLRIDGVPFVVLGVMGRTFDPLLEGSALWIPAAFTREQIADHDNHYLDVIARLKPEVSREQAQAELNVIAAREQHAFPIDDQDRGFGATPLSSALLGDHRLALFTIMGAVAFVLLIACANIACLQLARARQRAREIAVRAALGATPKRIVRQLVAENILIGAIGGVVGILLAAWGVAWLVAYGPATIPRLGTSSIDGTVLAFACGATLLSGVLFGLAPARRSASVNLDAAFKAGAGRAGGARDPVRSALVVGEIALALVLLAGAGLLIRSALLVSAVDPGFETGNLLVGRVGLPERAYARSDQARQAFEQMIEAASALPGVQSAAAVSRAPLNGGGSSNGLLAEGRPLDPGHAVNAYLRIVSPAYITTVHVPLVSGRNFTPQDTRHRTLVSIVNETLARTLWAGQNPIGKRFACCEDGPKGPLDPAWHEVVGVVSDVRAWGLDQQTRPEFYLPMAQMPPASWDWIGRTMDIVVRTPSPAATTIRELREAVARVAPGVPVYQVGTMEEKISGTLEQSHFDTFLLALFAATALLLASIAVYGVLSYLVTERRREIGIRMALGATRARVVRHVLGQGVRLTTMGLLLGLAGAFWATRLLASMLYGVRPLDPVTLGAVSLILAAVALIASYVPARRASRVDPTVALRYE
jgi:putative ABC transport system permease protein